MSALESLIHRLTKRDSVKNYFKDEVINDYGIFAHTFLTIDEVLDNSNTLMIKLKFVDAVQVLRICKFLAGKLIYDESSSSDAVYNSITYTEYINYVVSGPKLDSLRTVNKDNAVAGFLMFMKNRILIDEFHMEYKPSFEEVKQEIFQVLLKARGEHKVDSIASTMVDEESTISTNEEAEFVVVDIKQQNISNLNVESIRVINSTLNDHTSSKEQDEIYDAFDSTKGDKVESNRNM